MGANRKRGLVETGATLPANDLCQQRKRQLRNVYAHGCGCGCGSVLDDVGAMTEICEWKPYIDTRFSGHQSHDTRMPYSIY